MSDDDLIEGRLSRAVIGAFFEVYDEMGHGFLEHLHSKGMERELTSRGLEVIREKSVPVYFKEWCLGEQRIDMLVNDRLVVEIKSSYNLPKSAIRQLYNYLRCTDLEVGLLLHFGPKPAFHRQLVTNDRKPHGRLRRHTDLTDETDQTDEQQKN
jgi:hypothetical protein